MKKSEFFFARSLIKGKIAETVFAQMLRSTGQFTVLDFGYERIIPELVGQNSSGKNDDLVETLRTAPDFAVINKKTKKVHLIEVKYRQTFTKSSILAIANRMSRNWNPSYLFLASTTGFYFDEVKTIIKNKGKISLLKHSQIPDATQARFLKILNEFEDDL